MQVASYKLLLQLPVTDQSEDRELDLLDYLISCISPSIFHGITISKGFYVQQTRQLESALRVMFRMPCNILARLLRRYRSRALSAFINEGSGRIKVLDDDLPVSILMARDAVLSVTGTLRFASHLGGNESISINLARNSKLEIGGDFVIGNGVRIFVGPNATLSIGGRDRESDSGITCHSVIMANRRIDIGKDFICAWHVFISDSDWHSVSGVKAQSDVSIGDHVWIAHSSSVLKGSTIGNGCIVACHTKVGGQTFSQDSLVAGIPGRVVREGVNWKRDL